MQAAQQKERNEQRNEPKDIEQDQKGNARGARRNKGDDVRNRDPDNEKQPQEANGSRRALVDNLALDLRSFRLFRRFFFFSLRSLFLLGLLSLFARFFVFFLRDPLSVVGSSGRRGDRIGNLDRTAIQGKRIGGNLGRRRDVQRRTVGAGKDVAHIARLFRILIGREEIVNIAFIVGISHVILQVSERRPVGRRRSAYNTNNRPAILEEHRIRETIYFLQV